MGAFLRWAACAVVPLCLIVACSDDEGDGDDDAASGGSGASGSGAGATGGSGDGLASCSESCPDVVAAGCPGGPPTEADCVNGCEMIKSGPCADQYAALSDCAGPDPQFACSERGAVVVTGCEDLNADLSTCLGGGGG